MMGLIIDPCLPDKFGDFKVNRRFRDAEYYIEIHKPEGIQKGIRNETRSFMHYYSSIIDFRF